jgi:hypothetical protein
MLIQLTFGGLIAAGIPTPAVTQVRSGIFLSEAGSSAGTPGPRTPHPRHFAGLFDVAIGQQLEDSLFTRPLVKARTFGEKFGRKNAFLSVEPDSMHDSRINLARLALINVSCQKAAPGHFRGTAYRCCRPPSGSGFVTGTNCLCESPTRLTSFSDSRAPSHFANLRAPLNLTANNPLQSADKVRHNFESLHRQRGAGYAKAGVR